VPARLLVAHHAVPDPVRVEVVAALVEQARGLGLQDPPGEALADEPALAVAAVRVEAVADDPAPSRTASVTTATRLVVILEKSIYALRIGDAIGLVTSRMSVMRTDIRLPA
jgi:hypothetical protein